MMRHTPHTFFTLLGLVVLLSPPDAGAGSGGGTAYDTGGGAGAPSGASGAQGAAGAGAAAASTAYRLTDESMVDLGDGKPVKWSEARSSRFVPKEDHDRFRSAFDQGRELLISEGRRLDALQTSLNDRARQMQSGQSTQQSEADIADELGKMGLLDGQTAAKIVRELRAKGLAPLAQGFTRQQQALSGLETRLKTLEGRTAPLADNQEHQQFESMIGNSLAKIPEVKGLSQPVAALAAKHPVVKEILSDLYLSYDPKTWRPEDFHRMAAERLEKLVALVRDDQKVAVASAQDKRRQFFASRAGGAHPSGAAGYKHLSGRDIARESGLFDKAQVTT